MATYNGDKFLREQLDSLYTQTRVPDEIIAVDDCSTDHTVEILEEYHQRRGLKYVVNSSNQGVNANFYKAISLCSGNYVAICDQDDIWFPDKIEVSLNKIMEVEGSKPALVSSQSRDIDAEGRVIGIDRTTNDTWRMEDTLLILGNSQGCTLMMNRKLINLVKPIKNNDPIYDWLLANIAAISGIKYNIGTVLMYYRHHKGNVIAKIQDNPQTTLYEKLRRKVIYYKYDALIPFERVSGFNYLIRNYGDILSDKAYSIIKKAVDYEKSNTLKKIYLIGKFPISKERVIKIRKGLLIYGFLPFRK